MNRLWLLLFFSLSLVSCNPRSTQKPHIANQSGIELTDSSDMTNNFYDNTESHALPVKELTIEGEISNPGKVDFPQLTKHMVFVKETLLDSTGGDRFVGAYRYDGYSLFDILDKRVLKKVNSSEFNPIIDLFVEIENDKGQKVIFSWGEIFYPNNLHRIIIATNVSRIVPSKTKELWVLPVTGKIVAASDLITERNISDPVRITVRSYPKSFIVVKGLSPIYASEIKLFSTNLPVGKITSIPKNTNNVAFNTVFYGRGKGIHSTSPFTGVPLKQLIQKYYPLNRENLQSGILCLTGIDGYRCAVSYSELFNRNDQQEFLLVKTLQNEDGGLFRLFAACDFFSDRAVKSISEINLRY